MKAVTFSEFGGPEVLKIIDKPEPQPGPGEVVVRVAASTVNPTDLAFLNGVRAPQDLKPPFTAGMDFAGHIAAVGEGVTTVKPGQAVIGIATPRGPRGGAQAEMIRLPAASVAPVPDSTDLVAAATVPMNALTALLCLELLGLKPGQSLLITGAAGMLGSLAVETGLIAGLNVIATASEGDRDYLKGLGVKTFIPRGDGFEAALKAAFPNGVDGVIDGALIGQTISHLVRDGGGMISPRAAYRIEDPRLKVDYVQVTSGVEDAEKITRIGKLYGEGKLTPRVAPGGVFPFTRAADAFAMAAKGGFRGRVIMTFDA